MLWPEVVQLRGRPHEPSSRCRGARRGMAHPGVLERAACPRRPDGAVASSMTGGRSDVPPAVRRDHRRPRRGATGRAIRPSSGPAGRHSLGPPGALVVLVDRRRRVEQRLQDAPGLLDRVLACEVARVAGHCRVQQHLVRRRTFAAFGGEGHVEVDRVGRIALGVFGLHPQARPRGGADAQHELIRLRTRGVFGREPEPRRVAEHDAHLGDRPPAPCRRAGRRAPRPSPVVDLQPQRRKRLGGRVRGDAARHRGNRVLAADVVGGSAVRHAMKTSRLRSLTTPSDGPAAVPSPPGSAPAAGGSAPRRAARRPARRSGRGRRCRSPRPS